MALTKFVSSPLVILTFSPCKLAQSFGFFGFVDVVGIGFFVVLCVARILGLLVVLVFAGFVLEVLLVVDFLTGLGVVILVVGCRVGFLVVFLFEGFLGGLRSVFLVVDIRLGFLVVLLFFGFFVGLRVALFVGFRVGFICCLVGLLIGSLGSDLPAESVAAGVNCNWHLVATRVFRSCWMPSSSGGAAWPPASTSASSILSQNM